MRERMLAGEPYLASDPELVADRRRAMALLDRYNALSVNDREERQAVMTELAGSFGEGASIRPPFFCDYGTQLDIGEKVFANFGLVALDVAPIRIGAHTQMGPNVQLLTATHPLDPEERKAGWEGGQPISIGDNVWLGGGVIVLPGVTIGENTVVGAGAVVTKSLPANVLAVGNPARVVRHL